MTVPEILLKIVLPVVVVLIVGFLWWGRSAIREGVQEALQEAREEEAQVKAAKTETDAQASAAQQAEVQALKDRLSPADQHALSLRAVFSEVWIRDLYPEVNGQPQWPRFWTVEVPDSQREAVAESLRDGWNITDHDSALTSLSWLLDEGHRRTYAQVQAALDAGDSVPRREAEVVRKWQSQVGTVGGAAFDYARAVDVAAQALALGYLPDAEAWRVIRHCDLHARDTFGSWEQFGHSFQAGAEFWQSGGLVNRIRHGRYAQAVTWLLSDPQSPWIQVPWSMTATAGAQVRALN